MGSDDPASSRSERPVRLVRVKAFYLGRFEVTQGLYDEVCEPRRHHQPGFRNPADMIGRRDAREFCERLSDATRRRYRLPSEAEWEYACRAGSIGRYSFGDDVTRLEQYATFSPASSGSGNPTAVQPVGSRQANAFGLYDMHGNVMEWCADDWHDDYTGAPADARPWGLDSDVGILRGGGAFLSADECRSSSRYRAQLLTLVGDLSLSGLIGFRVALEE